jgi:hypothetical protein
VREARVIQIAGWTKNAGHRVIDLGGYEGERASRYEHPAVKESCGREILAVSEQGVKS